MKYSYPARLFAVVILYNKSVNNSTTLLNLQNLQVPFLKIVVIDNSTVMNDNDSLCRQAGFDYIAMNGNKGLSVAYNVALDYLQQLSCKNDLVIWFDDDTNISQEYFETLHETLLHEKNADVFVPIIYGQNGKIYSPNNSGFLKNKLLKSSTDKIDAARFNAINSCLAVRMNIYQNYRYDENLFLDLVDHNFFDDLRKMNAIFFVLRTNIKQNFFQRESKIDLCYLRKRMKMRVIDLMTYSCKNFIYTFLGVVKACGWGVVFGWKCKSVSVFFICLKYSLKGFFKNIIFFITQHKQYK